MTRQELENIITKHAGELPSISGLAAALKFDRHTISQMLIGVPYLPAGRSRRYLARDVAQRLIEIRKF